MRQHQGRNLHNCGIGQGHCDVAGASTAAGSAGCGTISDEPRYWCRGRDVASCKVRVFTTTASWKALTRVPVQLGRGPDEPPDSDLRAFYGRLLGGVADAQLQSGDWRLCECARWSDDDDSQRQLVAWCWSSSDAPSGGGQPLACPSQGPRAPAVRRPCRTNLEPGRQAEQELLRAVRPLGRRGLVRCLRGPGIALPDGRQLSWSSGTFRTGHCKGALNSVPIGRTGGQLAQSPRRGGLEAAVAWHCDRPPDAPPSNSRGCRP